MRFESSRRMKSQFFILAVYFLHLGTYLPIGRYTQSHDREAGRAQTLSTSAQKMTLNESLSLLFSYVLNLCFSFFHYISIYLSFFY